MSDPRKKVINPLFSSAVTGNTFEDFSQNATLLPAMEKPTPQPPPVVDLNQVQEPVSDHRFYQPPPTNFPHQQQNFFAPQPYNPTIEQVDLNQPPQQSTSKNLSSVFSSFSSILKFPSSAHEPEVEHVVAPPAGIESLLSTPQTVEPVPLFSPSADFSSFNSTVQAPPPANTFRRGGLNKRPVYAPVPGLSSSAQSNLPQPPTVQAQAPAIPPQSSILPEFIPQEQESSGNYFKPISPQPPTVTPIMATAVPELVAPEGPAISAELPQPSASKRPISSIYRPVYHHWFLKKEIEGKVLWKPFSMVDSLALDQAFTSNDLDPDKVVATEGGRFDVNILRRQRNPVYWKGPVTEVRRCSWFHKGQSDGKYIPYEENVATKLEEEYKLAYESNKWQRRVELANGEYVCFHSADVLVLFAPTQPSSDSWNNTPNQQRPRIVKRGMDEFDVDEGEPTKVDHLLFMVHGIGSVCDLKFRTVEEVVDEFRAISLQLVQSHYRSSCERGLANRVEVLPISWHEELHSEDTGIDRKLRSITLESIPRLRDFTNDTLLDILFYTSPVYCQTIISTVGNQLNRVYDTFKKRNPDFKGGISLGGHSLGSLILFDLLCHQQAEPETATEDTIAPLDNSKILASVSKKSRRISYMMGSVGTGQPQIYYPQLSFQPRTFFALGSPIGMFVTVRGLDNLGEDFALPTCPAFFNIFHPYDPVAYRVESLINPDLGSLKPVLVPHHKGRKRMHLELKETMARVGADLKQKVIDSMKSTWNSFYQLAMFHRQEAPSLEEEVDKAFSRQLEGDESSDYSNDADFEFVDQVSDLPVGLLNNRRRIDYVLQEAPFEFFNEYIFALTSHVCYWESEDTILLILKEIYATNLNVATDDKIPQQSMTIERPLPVPSPTIRPAAGPGFVGVDPTAPIEQNIAIGPPPMTGFLRKT